MSGRGQPTMVHACLILISSSFERFLSTSNGILFLLPLSGRTTWILTNFYGRDHHIKYYWCFCSRFQPPHQPIDAGSTSKSTLPISSWISFLLLQKIIYIYNIERKMLFGHNEASWRVHNQTTTFLVFRFSCPPFICTFVGANVSNTFLLYITFFTV